MDELLTSEKEIVYIILMAIALLLLMAVSIVLFFYFSRKKIVQAQLEKAEVVVAHQKELLQNTIITQEEERKRIAQDLHDAISSKLNVVSLNANILTGKDITPKEAQKIGEGIHKITATVLENSRRIAHDLLPPTLEKFGLQPALEELCEEIEETKKFDLQYNLSYAEGLLHQDNELHFFRIVQELFNNAIKHSEATQILLTLKTNEKGVSLQYQDNGKGFDIQQLKLAKGLGMSGIENRAALMEAHYELQSSPGNGLQVNINCKPTTYDAN